MRFPTYQTLCLSFLGLTLTACGVETDLKQRTANQIARPAFMVERKVEADGFQLKAWERMHQRNETATLYIEGLGLNEAAQNSSYVLDNLDLINPEPSTPTALLLASRDKSKNLAYLARPCQYLKMAKEKGCDPANWQEDRFSPEIISAYQTAMDDIKIRYDITGFNIVGYDGGANIAAILAGTRDDILTLRTVAGNVSPNYGTETESFIPLSDNAVMATDYASPLALIPQHHFVGAADDVVTPGNYHSYRQALGDSECVKYSLVQDADHTNGWVEKWPELLAHTPSCPKLHGNLPPLPAPTRDFPNSDFRKGPTKY